MKITYQTVREKMHTILPEVAKNWHQCGVLDDFSARIEKLKYLKEAVKYSPGETANDTSFSNTDPANDDNLMSHIQSEIDEITEVINNFTSRWPKPIYEKIADTIKHVDYDEYFEALKMASLEESLPNIPLVYLKIKASNDKDLVTLLYSVNGKWFIKVPNLTCNRPGARFKAIWNETIYGQKKVAS